MSLGIAQQQFGKKNMKKDMKIGVQNVWKRLGINYEDNFEGFLVNATRSHICMKTRVWNIGWVEIYYADLCLCPIQPEYKKDNTMEPLSCKSAKNDDNTRWGWFQMFALMPLHLVTKI